ncbi:hypothetical protein Tco_0496053 [Tanacetum coccineum]
MFYSRFTKIIIHHFLDKDKSISMRNRTFMQTAHDHSLLGTMRFISRHADTQVYGVILPEAMTNQALLDSVAYKTYYAIASGAEPPRSRKSQKKSDSAISYEESPSKKKYAKAKKVAANKPKPTKKKAPVKADRGKEVPDEQHRKTTGVDEGTGTIPGVPDVPKYESESDKESWGDSGEVDDDDEIDFENENDNGDNHDDGNDDDDSNDDDNDGDNDDNQEEHAQEEEEKFVDEEKIDHEEKIDEEEDDEVTKELYKDVNVNLGNEDTDMTNADHVLDTQKTDEPVQSSSVSSDFTSKLLNLKNPSLTNNEIASLMDTITRHSTAVPKIISVFTTTIPLPPPFFNPLLQQATPTPKSTTSVATTSFHSLLDFSSVFKFNDRVTNLEKDLSEIKQVDQYAQALSSIHAIVDHYIDNKLREAIQKAIVAHNLDCREEAQAEKRDYIELVNTSMRTILKEEVNTQLPQILPQAVLDFATLVIEKNVTESLEAAVLARELYDALVKSYQTDKDLFDSYGEVFMLKRSRDDRDKNQDTFAGSDRGTKRRKSSKEAESSIDSRSKEKKSLSTSKDASQSQHKHSRMSAHAEEPSYTVDDSGVQLDQEFDMGNNDEQPADKEVSKANWFKKPERPPTPNSDWNKRQHVDSRPPQT